jgi:hypothetical protein
LMSSRSPKMSTHVSSGCIRLAIVAPYVSLRGCDGFEAGADAVQPLHVAVRTPVRTPQRARWLATVNAGAARQLDAHVTVWSPTLRMTHR